MNLLSYGLEVQSPHQSVPYNPNLRHAAGFSPVGEPPLSKVHEAASKEHPHQAQVPFKRLHASAFINQ